MNQPTHSRLVREWTEIVCLGCGGYTTVVVNRAALILTPRRINACPLCGGSALYVHEHLQAQSQSAAANDTH